jgi:hypothetical protein
MSAGSDRSDPLRDVVRQYESVDEDSRLNTGWCRLELARTQELVLCHLPAAASPYILAVGQKVESSSKGRTRASRRARR